MSSWGQWLSQATYTAGQKLADSAERVTESDTWAQVRDSETWAQVRDGAVAVATKVGEGAVAAASIVEEGTETVISSASTMAERRLLSTNIALLESDLAAAKREWGLNSWDAMASDDLETVRLNFLRTKAVVDELAANIAAKERQIAELDAGPAMVETAAGVHVQVPGAEAAAAQEEAAVAEAEGLAAPRARGALLMPMEDPVDDEVAPGFQVASLASPTKEEEIALTATETLTATEVPASAPALAPASQADGSGWQGLETEGGGGGLSRSLLEEARAAEAAVAAVMPID